MSGRLLVCSMLGLTRSTGSGAASTRADPNNHLFGHLNQVLDNGGGVVLLRYP